MNRTHHRTAILGNSGSGKSTLARSLAAESDPPTPILDLDTIAWDPGPIPRPRERAFAQLDTFCSADAWILEGCYGDLVGHALARWQPELILLDPGLDTCLAHCRARPWEPHKYPSKAAQDQNLEFLLDWVADYYVREGPMSAKAHRALFDAYTGPKRRLP